MSTNLENNYYTPEEEKGYYCKNYDYTPNQPGAPCISFQNAQSLNDIPHKWISQKNSNEFYMKYNTKRWRICLFTLVSAGFIVILIIILLYVPDEENNKGSLGGIIFSICFCGFIFCLSIYGFITEPESLTFYLEQDSIRMKIILGCSCLQKNTILKPEDIQRFDIEYHPKSIFYINKFGKKKYLIDLDFFGDEGEYLVNVLNKHMGIEISDNNIGLL